MPHFAVATFKRVFQVIPTRDVLDLETLVSGLTRFILKPKLRKQIDDDISRVEKAWTAYEKGIRLGGSRWSAIHQAAKQGGKQEARKVYEKFRNQAQARTKTDLRNWSPVLYPPDVKRTQENVIHISCLVQDFDSGVTIREVSERWDSFFHIIHTTWSHQPNHPKFRVILPFAAAVPVSDWPLVWEWASKRVGKLNDSSMSSAASMYALPVTPGESFAREARVHQRALLHPVEQKIISHAAAPPPDILPPKASHFRGDPELKFISEETKPFVLDDRDFDLFRTRKEIESEDPFEDEFDLF